MLYCPDCKDMFPDEYTFCPVCGTKKIRGVELQDPVFLITKGDVWGGVVEEVLNDNKIPFLKINAGNFVCRGFIIDVRVPYDYYVPYGAFEKAAELVRELFDSSEDTCLEENDSEDKETFETIDKE